MFHHSHRQNTIQSQTILFVLVMWSKSLSNLTVIGQCIRCNAPTAYLLLLKWQWMFCFWPVLYEWGEPHVSPSFSLSEALGLLKTHSNMAVWEWVRERPGPHTEHAGPSLERPAKSLLLSLRTHAYILVVGTVPKSCVLMNLRLPTEHTVADVSMPASE